MECNLNRNRRRCSSKILREQWKETDREGGRERWIPRECNARSVLSYLRAKSLGQLAQTWFIMSYILMSSPSIASSLCLCDSVTLVEPTRLPVCANSLLNYLGRSVNSGITNRAYLNSRIPSCIYVLALLSHVQFPNRSWLCSITVLIRKKKSIFSHSPIELRCGLAAHSEHLTVWVAPQGSNYTHILSHTAECLIA